MNINKGFNVKFNENKIYYILVITFFCVGVILGTYTVKYMNPVANGDLSNYFTTFLKSLESQQINNKELLLNVLKNNILLIGLIIVVSLTAYGTAVILLGNLVKGFTLGYTFSFLVGTFGGKGMWIAVGSLLPQNLIYIPCFIALSVVTMEFSAEKMKAKYFHNAPKKRLVASELMVKCLIIVAIFTVGIFVEAYITPKIIILIMSKIY